MATIPGSEDLRQRIESVLGARLSAERRFLCPRCWQTARPTHMEWASVGIPQIGSNQKEWPKKYDLIRVICAGCGSDTIFVRCWKLQTRGMGHVNLTGETLWLEQVHPLGRSPRKFPNTSEKYSKDYEAACRTLEICPEASACMSRRCLQIMLRDQGYNQNDLGPQIAALLKEINPDKMLPKPLRSVVDAIRRFGNFGAHVQKDVSHL